MADFFEILQSFRRKNNYSKQKMAELLNISPKQYANYENGHLPPHDRLLQLNKLFNYDFSKLIYAESIEASCSKIGNEISEPFPDYGNVLHYKEQYLDYKEKYLRCQEELLTLKSEGGPGFRRKAN